MKTIWSVISALFLASQAQAAWIVPMGVVPCTLDINEWGHSGNCACPEGSSYNSKIGQCLKGDRYPILTQGKLRAGVSYIGGETTGFELETAEGTFELVVKLSEQEKLLKADGLFFEATGEFVLVRGVERPFRPTIIVESLNWLE